LHLRVCGFGGNPAASYLVRLRPGTADSKRRRCFLGSKALILFTGPLMPAELRLQSDRETQKSEIYFTDYTLAGQPGAYSFWKSDASRRSAGTVNTLRSDREALPYLFHRLHFDWATHRPSVGLTVRRRFQGPRHFYFTDYTLTGQPTAFPLHESESGLRLGGRVGLLVQPSFARRLPTLFHRLHFDWATISPPLERHNGWTFS